MKTRIAELEKKLSARMVGDRPAKGYKRNVAAIRAEIRRLKTPNKSGG